MNFVMDSTGERMINLDHARSVRIEPHDISGRIHFHNDPPEEYLVQVCINDDDYTIGAFKAKKNAVLFMQNITGMMTDHDYKVQFDEVAEGE